MLIRPLIERAGYHLFWMVLEIAMRGHMRIPCDLGSLRADLLKGPQILRILIFIRSDAEAAQQNTTHGVEGNDAGDILVLDDKIHKIARLRLTSWIRPRAELIRFRAPVGREISI